MTQTQAQEFQKSLLQQSPTYIEEWLKYVWAGEQVIPEPFNWLGLAEAAGTKANLYRSVEWAKVAILVYEWLAHATPTPLINSYIESAMRLRASMIDEKGAIPDDFVLGIDQIIRWFYESLPFSYEVAEQKAAVWKTLDIQEIKALRGIKNRLGVISALVKSGRLQSDRELDAWLSLRNKLP